MKSRLGRIVVTAGVVLCLGLAGRAAQVAAEKPAADTSNAPAKHTPWKPEDVVFTEWAGQFRVSPDNKWAAWVKSVAEKE